MDIESDATFKSWTEKLVSNETRRLKVDKQQETVCWSIEGDIDTMITKHKKEANNVSSVFFFGCNIPFAVVESNQFEKLRIL